MKYNYRGIYIFSLVCCTMLAACNKYLDIKPKGKTVLVTVGHYNQWLDDANVLGYTSYELDWLADNVDYPTITVPITSSISLLYTWAEQHKSATTEKPYFWTDHYACINKYNTVLAGIDDATEGTEEKKASLKAEALLGRAFEYLYLVNEYGPVYDAATANEDLAVPFVTSNDLGEPIPGRATVKQIYDHIIADIAAAIPGLPSNNSANRLRGSVAAAYSVLARAYLYMGDYTAAARNAQFALENTSAAMIDFNGALPASNLLSLRPDAIYAREGTANPPYCSLDFMHMLDLNDLRLALFYSNNDGYTFTVRGATSFYILTNKLPNNRGTSVQEMKLIIAEAAAREGDLPTALQQLNEIRVGRFSPSAYLALESNDQDTVLNLVLRERILELPFNGLRWFDMRRLDKEGRMDTVYRYDGAGNIIATLPPHSPKYTLQIPVQEMIYHPSWPQNPW